jgi:hypothetical protein
MTWRGGSTSSSGRPSRIPKGTAIVTIISLILFKYLLIVVAVIGLFESHLIFRLNRGDLRTLLREKVNGPKKLSTELRINQSAYLLAAFWVMFLIGVVQAFTPIMPLAFYMQPSVIVGRLGLIVVAVILITKQRSVRSHRDRLDIYYDEQQRALEDARIHTHRRATDPPTEGER